MDGLQASAGSTPSINSDFHLSDCRKAKMKGQFSFKAFEKETATSPGATGWKRQITDELPIISKWSAANSCRCRKGQKGSLPSNKPAKCSLSILTSWFNGQNPCPLARLPIQFAPPRSIVHDDNRQLEIASN